jgi:LPS sulfotransferase NodH
MLAATGVTGRPHSYFRQQDISYWADRWGVQHAHGTDNADFDRSYLSAMLREGNAGTGVFGVRIMWGSVADAAVRLNRVYGGEADVVARFEAAFGPTLFIHLSRLDKIAQAVSLVRAEQSGIWHLAADGSVLEGAATPKPIAYDAGRITALRSDLISHDAAWENFFAQRQIVPLRFTYETMAANPKLALAQVLSALGRDPQVAQDVQLRTAKMGDETSREWADRFRRESDTGI